ncbi:MAG: phosphoribosyl-AMP cyclohydrolase [Spirochaetes bacterium]|jgi:phosphoribosyl-AMP cyclohydrolase|nr:phosphoribosyl-AMP cyclohydrolase [Spirochaetota bacterium]
MKTEREVPRNGDEQAAAMDIDFEKLGGVVTAVVQEADTGEVLMVAYMDREALAATLETGYAHYYSRSRKRLWKKGEESGNVQELRELRVDCDQDAVLLKVRQHGAGACHTGNPTCFYRRYRKGELIYDPLPRSSV